MGKVRAEYEVVSGASAAVEPFHSDEMGPDHELGGHELCHVEQQTCRNESEPDAAHERPTAFDVGEASVVGRGSEARDPGTDTPARPLPLPPPPL